MPADQALNKDRNEIILEYYPMVRRVAYRMARRYPRSVDADDLVRWDGLDRCGRSMRRRSGGVVHGLRSHSYTRAIVDEMRKLTGSPVPYETGPMLSKSQRATGGTTGSQPHPSRTGGPLGRRRELLNEIFKTADVRVLVSTEEGGDDDLHTLIDASADVDEIVARRHSSTGSPSPSI